MSVGLFFFFFLFFFFLSLNVQQQQQQQTNKQKEEEDEEKEGKPINDTAALESNILHVQDNSSYLWSVTNHCEPDLAITGRNVHTTSNMCACVRFFFFFLSVIIICNFVYIFTFNCYV